MTENDSPEAFHNLPQDAAYRGNTRHIAEGYGEVQQVAERTESHILTVKEVARMFEAAGVARIERSIVNWCQPNKLGVPRLDCFFDQNERKYFITPKSVELAIKEEQAKATKTFQDVAHNETPPQRREAKLEVPSTKEADDENANEELKTENRDLRITNAVKDQYITRLEEERDGFVKKLMDSSHRIGVLETKLLQLEAPSTSANGVGDRDQVA